MIRLRAYGLYLFGPNMMIYVALLIATFITRSHTHTHTHTHIHTHRQTDRQIITHRNLVVFT